MFSSSLEFTELLFRLFTWLRSMGPRLLLVDSQEENSELLDRLLVVRLVAKPLDRLPVDFEFIGSALETRSWLLHRSSE